MTLSAETLAKITKMHADGGRTIAGRWYGINTDTTTLCKDGGHDRCGGWVFPIGGARECPCPCHDDRRPAYREALAIAVKASDWWRVGDFVTVAGTAAPWWRVTFVDNRAKEIRATDPDGQTTVAQFSLLNLYR